MAVPIIGQQFSIVSFTVQPVLKCHCEQSGVIALMAQFRDVGWQRTQEQCPACKRQYSLAQISVDESGQVQFSIEMTQPAPAPELVLQ